MNRDEFMELVYAEFASDPDNNRANRIIEAADEYAESYNKWVPVSDRLPKDIGEYLITDEHEYLYIARYDFFNDHTVRYWRRYFKAWMPLPEPYTERRTDG